MQIAELLERWQTDKGKPYKGRLIDRSAYEADPDNIGCMCAQGQALHLLGGWTPERLSRAEQFEADCATAKLFNIGRSHAVLLRVVNDRADGAPDVVLTDPGKVLGDQWSKLLDFWWYLGEMPPRDRLTARDAARQVAGQAARRAATDAAGRAATDAAGQAAWDAAWRAAGQAAGQAAQWASWETQGAAILRRDGKPFVFLPAFGFNSPDDIPARPADYGIAGR
jgi:hypothetical protein